MNLPVFPTSSIPRWIGLFLLSALLCVHPCLLLASPTAGTISWAKVQSPGTVLSQPLTDKVVSAVFSAPNTTNVAYFYVQEPQGFTAGACVGGIKVVPPLGCPAIRAGDVVTLAGSVSVDCGEECRLAASSVAVTAATTIAPPIGISQRTAASAAYGLQPALARDPTFTTLRSEGRGLCLVGCRVTICGRVRWISNDRSECCIDDGSRLNPSVGGSDVTGIRVIYSAGHTCPTAFQVGYYVTSGITGVLGAEAVGSNHVGVPVLRVPSSVVHVKIDGDDNANGLSWATAKLTIQAAVDQAFAMQPKGEVWVAAGDHYTYASPGFTLKLRDGVAVYGGFVGNETERDRRDWQANPTTINALCMASVVTASFVGPQTRIDGFTITWGESSDSSGGGIHCESSSLVIANNRFADNTYSGRGGAIGCTGGAPVITGNVIVGNNADFSVPGQGGGIYCENSSPIISDNTITQNAAANTGGGIYCTGGSPTIVGNTITENTSRSGAGIYCTGGSCTISRNIISSNSGYLGGGIYCDSSDTRISNNVLTNNACSDGYAGGIYVAAGTASIVGNTLRSNIALYGGGFYVKAGSPMLANNIVASGSSGIWCFVDGTPSLSRNDVTGNEGQDYRGILDITGNFSKDPLFLADGFHISANSPCAGAGDPTVLQVGELDIDGQPRVQPIGGMVDVGADESSNCGWRIDATASTKWAPLGQAISIQALLADNNGVGIPQQRVTFAITEGNGHLTRSVDTTGSDGIAHTSVTSNSIGWVTITASVTDQCEGVLQATARINFQDTDTLHVDIILCLDSTGSMRSGGDHSAIPSVEAFLNEMTATYGIQFRIGAVRFNEGIADLVPDHIADSQKLSLGQFTSVASITNWLDTYYAPDGGDGPELQLDALHYAGEDLDANATSVRKYILLITDTNYHENEGGSLVTKSQVISELTDIGCPVYISLWNEQNCRQYYSDLVVNGGEIDSPNPGGTDLPGNYKYPLARLRSRILSDW